MSEWQEFREELLRDPEVKAAFDAQATEREMVRAIIRQRLEKNTGNISLHRTDVIV